MSLSTRFFIYHNKQAIKVSQAKYQRFQDGEAEFKEYAGETLKLAEFVVMIENKEVLAIVSSSYYLQKVTDKGTQDRDFELDKMRYAINQIKPIEVGIKKEATENIIDASSQFEERRLDAQCVWEPEYEVVSLLEKMVFE